MSRRLAVQRGPDGPRFFFRGRRHTARVSSLASLSRRCSRLLRRDVLDALPLSHVGSSAQLRTAWVGDIRVVAKIALPRRSCRARVRQELRALRALGDVDAFDVPVVFAVGDAAFVRAYVAGDVFGDAVRDDVDGIADDVIDAFVAACAVDVGRLGPLDLSPDNFVVRPASHGARLVLLDAGRRKAPGNPFADVRDRSSARAALARWRDWRLAVSARGVVVPALLPPSGRFHVAVPVGVDPSAQLLWRNETALARAGAAHLSDRQLVALGAWSTTTPHKTEALPATRYQDTAVAGRGQAKGDGRAVILGRWTPPSSSTAASTEISLKGVGPTPLAWRGHAFHEDGRVSVPRALWEAAVGDELARLGFGTSECWGLVSTGASTVDNTERSWPAAAALRASTTHLRLGHLVRVQHDRSAARGLLQHAADTIFAPGGFDVDVDDDVFAFACAFADGLGYAVGKSDALSIHCFNPTMGNVRLDGRFIDFSTVRFFEHRMPDYALLEGRWRAGQHRAMWRRWLPTLVAALAHPRLLARPEQRLRALFARFDRRCVDGAIDGAALCFGDVFARAAAEADARARAAFVEAWRALRDRRGPSDVCFPFFRQTVRGPLFDLEFRAPTFFAAWGAGEREPWRSAVVAGGAVGDDDARVAEDFVAALGGILDRRARARVRPRRHPVRPFLFVNELARRCYEDSAAAVSGALAARLSTSNHLPPGRHRYEAARAMALERGHVALRTLGGNVEVIVGLTRAIRDELRTLIRAHLGADLVGVVLHGSRVVPRDVLAARDQRWARQAGVSIRPFEGVREHGFAPETSDLDIKVFVRRPASSASLAHAIAALGTSFRIVRAEDGVAALHLHATGSTLAEAFTAYNGRRVAQGRPCALSPLQCAVLLDVEVDDDALDGVRVT